MEWWIWEFCI